MSIPFNQISNTNRVPGAQIEIDASKAKSRATLEPHHVLFIGTRLSTGSATEGQIKSILGELDGDAYFDAKAVLSAMTRAFKRINKTAKCSAMALDAEAGGTAASGTFPLVGTASADGTLRVRIGDQRISVSIASGVAANTAGAVALAAAINATERCPFSATSALGTVTITFRSKGLSGNFVTIEVESLPTGITCTPVQPASGATDPTVADAISALGDERYDTIVCEYSAAANLALLEAEATRRWGPTVKQPVTIIVGYNGSHGTLTTYGSARNSPRSIVMGSGNSPTPPWIWAAQAAARDAQRCDTMPNRPRKGLTLPDCEAPKVTERFDHDDRNLLYFDGISSYVADQSGNVSIDRLITTYQTDANGQADKTYLSAETVRNLADLYLRKLQLAGKYQDYLIAEDGTKADDGVPILTPKAWRGELIAWYEGMEKKGRVKDLAGYTEDLRVEIDEDDPERMNTESPDRLVNGLVTMAMKVAFQL